MRTAALVTPPRASPGPRSYLRNVIRERVARRKRFPLGPLLPSPATPSTLSRAKTSEFLAGKFEIVRSFDGDSLQIEISRRIIFHSDERDRSEDRTIFSIDFYVE